MFLAWCSLKIDSYFFAMKPFGFSVLAATENESEVFRHKCNTITAYF